MTIPKENAFEKKVIRLADGRELIYYEFTSSPPGSEAGKTRPAPEKKTHSEVK